LVAGAAGRAAAGEQGGESEQRGGGREPGDRVKLRVRAGGHASLWRFVTDRRA
ncbi:MAG: hypothetical protein QOI73_2525, partial [Solirubrobacteraceae bacterium]|nr:hypothetical protein [Solirubrobacteraceae bacterium]